MKSASSIFYKHTRPNSENLTTTYLFEKFNGSEKFYRNSQRHENTPLIIGPQTYWTKFDTAKKSTSYWKELAHLRYWRSIEFEFLEPQITKFFSKTKKKIVSLLLLQINGMDHFPRLMTIQFQLDHFQAKFITKETWKKWTKRKKISSNFVLCTYSYLPTYLAT